MNAYLIIGDAKTGKSSLIRCLTGYDQPGIGNFALTNGIIISTQVVISALQKYSTHSWRIPSNYIQDVQNDLKKGLFDSTLKPAILVPLWEHSNNGYPAASQYITAFQQAGWLIVKTALLNSQTPPTNYPQCKAFTGVTSKPINVTAADVRQHFGWI